MVQSGGVDEAGPRLVQAGVLAGDAHGDTVDVGPYDGPGAALGGGDGEHAGAAAHVQDAAIGACLEQTVVGQKAAGGGSVVAGAESRAGLDSQVDRIDRRAAKVVHAVDEEPAGPHRRQAGQGHGQPVGVRQGLGLHLEGREAVQRPAEGIGLLVGDGKGVDAPAARGLVLFQDGIGRPLQHEIAVDGRSRRLGLRPGPKRRDLNRLAAHS